MGESLAFPFYILFFEQAPLIKFGLKVKRIFLL